MLAELEGKGREAKLAARADVGQRACIEPGLEVVAMGSEARGSTLDVLVASFQQRGAESGGIQAKSRGAVGEIESRSAAHGFEAQVDGRTHAGQVASPGGGDFHGGLGDSVVPELELSRSAESALKTAQQGVASGEEVLVGGEMGRVGLVDLGHGQVEPASAAGRGAGPEVEVGGREADGQEAAGQIGQAGEDAVDSGAATDAG